MTLTSFVGWIRTHPISDTSYGVKDVELISKAPAALTRGVIDVAEMLSQNAAAPPFDEYMYPQKDHDGNQTTIEQHGQELEKCQQNHDTFSNLRQACVPSHA